MWKLFASLAVLTLSFVGCRVTDSGVKDDNSIQKFDLGFSSSYDPIPYGKDGLCSMRHFRTNTNIGIDSSINGRHTEEFSEFDTSDVGIDGNAHWMMVASSIAYSDEANAIAQFKKIFGAKNVTSIKGKRGGVVPMSSQVFVVDIEHDSKFDVKPQGNQKLSLVSAQDATLIVFTGTQIEEKADIFTDIRNAAVPFMDPKGRGLIGHVHSGFNDAFTLNWPDIWNAIKDKNKPIFLTGHSMGAALATLATANLLAINDPKAQAKALYTFGSPRLGLGNFVEWFDKSATNMDVGVRMFVTDDDLITTIPDNISGLLGGSITHILRGGWRHVGQNKSPNEVVTWIQTRPSRKVSRDDSALNRLTLKSRNMIFKIATAIRDHYVPNYNINVEEVAFATPSVCNTSSRASSSMAVPQMAPASATTPPAAIVTEPMPIVLAPGQQPMNDAGLSEQGPGDTLPELPPVTKNPANTN